MYKLQKNLKGEVISVWHQETLSCIPLNPANTDYANFKKEILADEAQLQDADGNTMTAEQAKTYVGGLA
jgi:hypothetical protein